MTDEHDPTDQGVSAPAVPGGHSRRTDPETSKDAGSDLASSKRLGELQAAVLHAVTLIPGATSSEVFDLLTREHSSGFSTTGPGAFRDSVTPRLSELREAGLVENEPEGSKDRKKADRTTGRACLRWWKAGESPTSKRRLAPGQGALFAPPREFD